MEQKHLLQDNSRFGDYEIVTRMSLPHVGDCEAYRDKSCKTGEFVAMTVFTFGCKPYKSVSVGHKKCRTLLMKWLFCWSK